MKSALAVIALFASTVLAQTSSISGVVKTSDGLPAAGMHVSALLLPIESSDDTSAETDSDDEGRFSFATLAPGKYTVSASSPTIAGGWTDVEVTSAGSAPVTITVGGESRLLSGTVRGVPAANVHVLVARWDSKGVTVFSPRVIDSRYAIALPSGAHYAMQAVAAGCESETAVLQPGETTRDLVLERVFRQAPADVVTWIAKTAVPLKTVTPGAGFDDMTRIRTIVGDARIVALGEATHGTREFFQFKHRMLEYLVTKAGFDVFAIEASFPDTLAVNEFVLNGTGDATQALARMQFWTWNTEEVLALIRWMRAWNLDPAHSRKLRFYGFDMQNPSASVRLLRGYLQQHASDDSALFDRIAPALIRDYAKPTAAEAQTNAMAALDELLPKLDAVQPHDRDWAMAREQVELIRQGVRLFGAAPASTGGVRDRALAENIQWLLAHEPAGTKMVVWAHNLHVSTEPYPFAVGGTMGTHLRTMFGKDLLVFGAAFNRGTFRASGGTINSAVIEHTVLPLDTGSFDRTLADAGPPMYVLDLRGTKATVREWLDSRLKNRAVGAMYDDARPKMYSLLMHPSRSFDAVFFIRDTTAAVPVEGKAPAVQLPPPAAAAVNLDFARGTEGWRWAHLPKEAFDVIATSEGCVVAPCLRMSLNAGASAPQFGVVMQRIDATPYPGQKVRFRAKVRSQLTSEASSARIWMRVDLPRNAVGFFDNMDSRLPKALPEWTELQIVGDVAPNAEAIAFGGLIGGSGTVWYDEATLEIVPPQ